MASVIVVDIDSLAADANAADPCGAASVGASVPPVIPAPTGDTPPSGLESFREAEELRLAVAASSSEIALVEDPSAGLPALTLTDGDVDMALTFPGSATANIGAAGVTGANASPSMDPATAGAPCAVAGPLPTQADTTPITAGAIAAGTPRDADTGASVF